MIKFRCNKSAAINMKVQYRLLKLVIKVIIIITPGQQSMLESSITPEFIENLFKHPKFTQNFHRMLNESEFLNKQSQDTSSSNHQENSQYSQLNPEKYQISQIDDHCSPYKLHIDEFSQQRYHSSLYEELYTDIADIIDQRCIKSINQRVSQYVNDHYQTLREHIDNILQNQSKDRNGNRQHPESQTLITFEQYKNCEYELLEKIDVCIHRNSCKIQSIFSDKLNTAEIKIFDNIHDIYESLEALKQRQLDQPKKSEQRVDSEGKELIKKLKASKSIGNLFGLK